MTVGVRDKVGGRVRVRVGVGVGVGVGARLVDLGHAALRREPDARLAVEALGQDLEREVGSGVVVDEAAPAAHVGVLGVHVQVIMHLHNVLARHAHTTLRA